MTDLVTVGTFLSGPDAELARAALEAAGIDAMIRADDCEGVQPGLWMGGVAILVRSEDADRAHEVLETVAVPAEPAPD